VATAMMMLPMMMMMMIVLVMISARNYAHACPNTDAHHSRLLLVCCSGQNKGRPPATAPVRHRPPLPHSNAPVESDVTRDWADAGRLTWMNCIVIADLPTPPPPTTTSLYVCICISPFKSTSWPAKLFYFPSSTAAA